MIALRRVVFPEPLGPMSAVILLAGNESEKGLVVNTPIVFFKEMFFALQEYIEFTVSKVSIKTKDHPKEW